MSTKSNGITITTTGSGQGTSRPNRTQSFQGQDKHSRPQRVSTVSENVHQANQQTVYYEKKSKRANSVRSSQSVIDEEKEIGFRTASNTSPSNANPNRSNRYSRSSNGIVNNGFIGSTPSISSSVPVIREQYCYCAKWSKFEKTLVITVSVLAFMVVVLVITVGVLAQNGSEHNNPWSVF